MFAKKLPKTHSNNLTKYISNKTNTLLTSSVLKFVAIFSLYVNIVNVLHHKSKSIIKGFS